MSASQTGSKTPDCLPIPLPPFCTAGCGPLDENTMEKTIEVLERHCHENMNHAIETEEGLGIEYDEDVICDVCRSPDSEDGNDMVFCDKCNICVHQVSACGGVDTVLWSSFALASVELELVLNVEGFAICWVRRVVQYQAQILYSGSYSREVAEHSLCVDLCHPAGA